MRPSSRTPPAPVDSIVINGVSSNNAPLTTLLHSPESKSPHHHHLYNYWTLNERLRSRNEKLFRRQQSSCRLAFYSMWLFVFAGVMAIIVYRFTDDCPLAVIHRKEFLLRCSRHLLFLAAFALSFLACSGLIYGACRYFRSQPQPLLYDDEHELCPTHNYNTLPMFNASHSCCCQRLPPNGTAISPCQRMSHPNEEHSSATLTSLILNQSPQRKMPPFTYDEYPPSQCLPMISVPASPIRPVDNANFQPLHDYRNKKIVFSTSNSAPSSPQSIFSTAISYGLPNAAAMTPNPHNNSNNKRKSTLTFEDTYPSTPTSYTTCVCTPDVWEKQPRPSIS